MRKRLKSTDRVIGQSGLRWRLGQLAHRSPAAAMAVAILIRALDSSEAWIRVSATEALGNFGREAATAIPRLHDLEQSAFDDLRNDAIEARGFDRVVTAGQSDGKLRQTRPLVLSQARRRIHVCPCE